MGLWNVPEVDANGEAFYRWEVTRDRLLERSIKKHGAKRADGSDWDNSAVGTKGPSNLNSEVRGNAARFSLYDDDGNCHYEGIIYGEYSGFEPLDDFGMPNAGCTAIKINGEWL
jgi:hypothetical protein